MLKCQNYPKSRLVLYVHFLKENKIYSYNLKREDKCTELTHSVKRLLESINLTETVNMNTNVSSKSLAPSNDKYVLISVKCLGFAEMIF